MTAYVLHCDGWCRINFAPRGTFKFEAENDAKAIEVWENYKTSIEIGAFLRLGRKNEDGRAILIEEYQRPFNTRTSEAQHSEALAEIRSELNNDNR